MVEIGFIKFRTKFVNAMLLIATGVVIFSAVGLGLYHNSVRQLEQEFMKPGSSFPRTK